MMKTAVATGILLALDMSSVSYGSIIIDTVGDGSGYDILGTGAAGNEATAFRSTDVTKTFDADGNNEYGTAGLFFYGDGGVAGNGQIYGRNTQDWGGSASGTDTTPSWATFSAPTGFGSVSVQAAYGPYDNPTLSGADVADWGNQGIGTATAAANQWASVAQFTVDSATPERFRVGIMSCTQGAADGRWDPTALRITADGGTTFTTILGLTNNGNSNPNWVFFNVDLDGETSGTFIISGQSRSLGGNTRGTAISGVTFDIIPEPTTLGLLGLGALIALLIRRQRTA